MITHPHFHCDPWRIVEHGLDLDVLAQTESLFALSNGHIGLRGNLDEGEPHVISGTYLNAFYETRPLPYAEAGYGYPEAGQTVVNVTNGKVIRLLVDDETFDVRYGRLLFHRRCLDLRAGILERTLEWCSPAGCPVRISSTRLVSFDQRAVAAILYEIEPLDQRARFVVQSELVANEPLKAATSHDPRAAAALEAPLRSEDVWEHGAKVVLIHSTKLSELRMAAGMDHVLEVPEGTELLTESNGDLGRVTVSAELEPGQSLRLVKFLAYGWSSQRSIPSLRAQVDAALAAARHSGWQGLVQSQRQCLDRFWDQADVEVDGDEELQQAVRFGLFHVLQSAVRAEERAVAAKGLTGPGYDGHCFWDSESFVLQVLTYTAPQTVAPALRWRHSTLPAARERARLLGLEGASFPWRTISGQECSGYWPASTAAIHVNADIADAVIRYVGATEDLAFEREVGLEILVETARFWVSVGHHRDGQFRIDGVTGPDEYTALTDNNVYTNLMAQRNLETAADAVDRHPERARELSVKAGEPAAWRAAAQAIALPFDAGLGVHQQCEDFTQHEVWDFASTHSDQYPLLLHFPYFDIYRKQVIKQADLVLALHLRGDAFTAEQKRRAFDYYEPLTVRDSSLSACTQSVMAAEVGHLELAYDYFAEAALMDLEDLEHNVRDGVHMASLAGSWIAAVAGFGGMRDHGGHLTFTPRLPSALRRLAFRLLFRGRLLKVEVTSGEATYALLFGEPLEIIHHGELLKLRAGRRITLPLPADSDHPAPAQPPGRVPMARSDWRERGSQPTR